MTITLNESTIPLVRSRFAGDVLEPGDAGYDEARSLFNAMIDRRPRLIVRCTGAADVVAGILLARETGLPLAIHSGGHGVNGFAMCDDGIVVDLSPMKRIDVDPEARTARAQAGVTWGEFDAATQAHGLATTGGRITTTGIAGLTLGTGSGWLERKLGFAADNLIAADMVTADGRLIHASEGENAELFWGLRGGGGNFGVVTDFTYRLHEVGPTVLGGLVLWPIEQAGEVLRAYREFMAGAPDEVSGGGAILTAPPAPFVPPEFHGKHMVAVIAAAFTDLERAEELWRPMRDFGSPVADVVGPMPYTALQQILDANNPKGLYNYWKAELVRELPDELIDAVVAHGDAIHSGHSVLFFQPLGGELARISEGSSAISARNAPWALHCIGEWVTPEETDYELGWVRAWAPIVEPYKLAGIPLTFSADAGDERVRATYGGEKYARLVALKDEYDPENLFRLNQNIKPSTSG